MTGKKLTERQKVARMRAEMKKLDARYGKLTHHAATMSDKWREEYSRLRKIHERKQVQIIEKHLGSSRRKK